MIADDAEPAPDIAGHSGVDAHFRDSGPKVPADDDEAFWLELMHRYDPLPLGALSAEAYGPYELDALYVPRPKVPDEVFCGIVVVAEAVVGLLDCAAVVVLLCGC